MNISILLRGGLGNQLFQLTAGVFFAKKWSATLILDDRAIIRHDDKSRRTWLRKFDIEELFSYKKIQWVNYLSSRLNSTGFCKGKNPQNYLDEKQIKQLSVLSGDICVYDWFQTNEYLPVKRLCLDLEHLRSYRGFVLDDAGKREQSEESAAIHIRLGDFKTSSWGVLSDEWYQIAVLNLASKGITSIDCFSDDISEASRIMAKVADKVAINFPEVDKRLRPHELLFIMSRYRYFISSNSTLSWWASYFNSRENSEIFSAWDQNLIMPKWKTIRL